MANPHSSLVKFLRNFHDVNWRSYWAFLGNDEPPTVQREVTWDLRRVEVVLFFHIGHETTERFILQHVVDVNFRLMRVPHSRVDSSSILSRGHLRPLGSSGFLGGGEGIETEN